MAITRRERNPALPEVPTFVQVGIKGVEVVNSNDEMAPIGTPKDVVAKLSDAFQQVEANQDLRKAMTAQGADPAFLNNEQFGAYLAAQMPVRAKAVNDAGAKFY